MKKKKSPSIFNQLFQIKGKHAEIMRQLTSILGCRNLDVFYLSIVLGLEYRKTAQEDFETKNIEPAKIDPEQMIKYNDDIQFFYRMVLLADDDYCPSAQRRMDKAFRDDIDSKESDERHFVEVMLGGLECLHEQIKRYSTLTDKSGLFNSLYELLDNFHAKHPDITEESLRKM